MLESLPKSDLSPAARDDFDRIMSATPRVSSVSVETGAVGGIPGQWCLPRNEVAATAILYLHGGGYTLGSAAAYVNFVSQLAHRTGVRAFVADYRLAPEHRFPAAVQDALAAYAGLLEMGYRSIALVGDSAGGGLALSLLAQLSQFASHTGQAAPKCAAVISPWTDLSLSGESMESRAQADPLLSREVLAKAADAYLGGAGADRTDPRASPLFATTAHLPPVSIHVGADEVLLDDTLRYARAHEAAEAHVWEGMVHVFASNVAQLGAARDALDDISRFLRTELGIGKAETEAA